MRNKELPTPFELFGLEIGSGWIPLVEQIINRIQELNAQGAHHIEIRQIKQKWGLLCIYLSNAPEEVLQMVKEAEAKALHICERCGRPASQTISKSHWIYTLCPECLKEKGIVVDSELNIKSNED